MHVSSTTVNQQGYTSYSSLKLHAPCLHLFDVSLESAIYKLSLRETNQKLPCRRSFLKSCSKYGLRYKPCDCKCQLTVAGNLERESCHCLSPPTTSVVRYGRFPKFHRIFFGRDPGTLKSDIVSKKHPQLICSDLKPSNWKFEDWKYGNRPYCTLPWQVLASWTAPAGSC